MDGVLWFLAQLAIVLAAAAVVFFFLGRSLGARPWKTRVRELEARLDEEDRARKLALEERDTARAALGATGPHPEAADRPSGTEWQEAQQHQQALEREILRLSDELRAARTAPPPAPAPLPEEAPPATQPSIELDVTAAADDLTRIKGIGPVIARKLEAAGIRRYAQIAAWTDADVQTFSDQLAFKGRVQRDQWREQARALLQD